MSKSTCQPSAQGLRASPYRQSATGCLRRRTCQSCTSGWASSSWQRCEKKKKKQAKKLHPSSFCKQRHTQFPQPPLWWRVFAAARTRCGNSSALRCQELYPRISASRRSYFREQPPSRGTCSSFWSPRGSWNPLRFRSPWKSMDCERPVPEQCHSSLQETQMGKSKGQTYVLILKNLSLFPVPKVTPSP